MNTFLRKYLLFSFIVSMILGCQLFELTNIEGSMVGSIYIEKNTVCIGEDLLISIDKENEENINTLYNIHNHTGNKAIIKFSTPGQKHVSVTEKNLLNLKIKNTQIEINVENCQSDNVISIMSTPDKSNLGVFIFKADINPHLVKEYKWDFGDGNLITTNNPFISHDFRMRKQDELFSSSIVKVIALGLNGKKFTGRTSITMTNTDLISQKLGNPTIPTSYNRFIKAVNNKYNLEVKVNNIYNDTFAVGTVTMQFKNHTNQSIINELYFTPNDIFDHSSFAGNKLSNLNISIPKSIVPQNTTIINLYIKGTLGPGQNALSKIYLDVIPENNDLVASQGFEEITNPDLINKLQEAEKNYGINKPITSQQFEMFDGNYQNNTNIQGQWVFVPTKAHDLKKGDVILTKDPEGLLSPLFNNLGIVWDHTLMAIDNNATLRHNTMKLSEELQATGIEMKDYTFRVYDPYDYILLSKETFALPQLIDKNLLQGLPPGIMNGKRSPGMYKVKLTTARNSNRPFLEGTADEIIKMEGNYILHSFINLEAYEPTYNNIPANYNQGSQCSGTIWWANKRRGLTMDVPVISQPETLLFASTNVYNTFVEYFTDMLIVELNNEFNQTEYTYEDDTNILMILLNYGISSLEDYVKDSYKDQVMKHLFETHKIPQKFANQMVNTFLFNRTDDTSDYWRYHYSEVDITSVSPDDLLMSSIPEFSKSGTGNSKYDLIENYTEGGGYYIKIY